MIMYHAAAMLMAKIILLYDFIEGHISISSPLLRDNVESNEHGENFDGWDYGFTKPLLHL